MKYRAGDLVKYYNDGKVKVGTITELQDCAIPYIINDSAFYESLESLELHSQSCKGKIKKTDYVIKKIKVEKTSNIDKEIAECHRLVDKNNIEIKKEKDTEEFKKLFNHTMDKIAKTEEKEIKKEKHAGGRPLKFKTVEELQEKIQEYKQWVEENEKPLTIERLACFLGCDRMTLLNYEQLEGREQFFITIKEIKSFILADKAERLNSPEGNKAGVIFDLKNNHGFKDRSETEHSTPDGKPFQIERKNLSEKEIDARILELNQKLILSNESKE